ncbi:MAG TPA: hypothetical protein VFV99_23175 [Kofleriaceae bacterium]|nr:hypothetical protein [Kofleriaceae bacterium]
MNRDVNVNGDYGHYHGGYYGGGWGYGVGAGVVAGTAAGLTAAAIGSVAYSLPPSCATVYSYGSPYYHCGSTYYAPQYQGDDVTYVVVNPPEGTE